mmetsp:Transcript_63101/g.167307  ORF Transcript_63101/g.167307 Transcript_63101/m.167307 type:complete len:231 (-) Transcript_63101:191-883(-)
MKIRPQNGSDDKNKPSMKTEKWLSRVAAELHSVSPERPTPEKVHWCVVDKMPNQSPDHTIPALVDFGRLNHLFLHCGELSLQNLVARTLPPVRCNHETCVMRSQGSSEHSCSPRPVHARNFNLATTMMLRPLLVKQCVDLLDVRHCDHCLLFTRVRNFWNWWNRPLVWRLPWRFNTTIIAVSHSKHTGIVSKDAPSLTRTSCNRQRLVHQDPPTTTWPLLAQSVSGHKVV